MQTSDTLAPAAPSEAPPFGLIIIGDEIMSGKRADKHLPAVIERLQARGLQLAYADYVGDAPSASQQTLRRAFASGTSCFPAAASAPRRTTTPASVQRWPPWACRWNCIRRREAC
jgi:hypothetical protein